MNPVVLYRKGYSSIEELETVRKYFKVKHYRTECQNELVIPRYSSLPFYRELEQDLFNCNCRLINSYNQHRWIANFEYYDVVRDYTPETWYDSDFYLCQDPGPFVVKGKTNSHKNQWNKLMFAPDKKAAINIANDLMSNDNLISEQGIVYRKYVPLKTFEIGVNGLPFTNEFRFFYYKTTQLAYGYYWSIADDISQARITTAGLELADRLATIVADFVNFFVLDIAETEEGEWILIEINDGTMSGLEEVNPDELYGNLEECFK